VIALWNAATVLGALGARELDDPQVLGLDAAAPAAFLALLSPRLHTNQLRALAIGAAILALALTPVTPLGAPILVVAAATALLGWTTSQRAPS
jgi:predicted branched-subunit amino acid permease